MNLRLVALLVLTPFPVVFAQPPGAEAPAAKPAPAVSFTPSEVVRGGTISVHVPDAPAGTPARVSLSLHQRAAAASSRIVLIPTTTPTQLTVTTTYVVPEVPIGAYDVRVDVAGYASATAPTPLAVTAPQPKIDSVDPRVPYPGRNNTFELVINGDRFSPFATENVLVVDGNPVPPCNADMTPANCAPAPTVSGDRRQLTFGRLPRTLQGRHEIDIAIGGSRSENTVDIVFSAVPRSAPSTYALIATSSLAALVILLVLPAWRHAASGGARRSLVGMFVYDRLTSSYSLSVAQFYLWTLVVVAGYVYLTASRSLVQGKFEWADVPGNLPGILLISAGTAVVATGVGADKTKGAGAAKPSVSDFVTSGGLVIPERIQFVVWTILGATFFLFFVFAIDPAVIERLPSVPSGFLYLMGISSAGYLGGKLARPAGPVIFSAEGKLTAGSPQTLAVNVIGRNLSERASLTINGEEMTGVLPTVIRYEEDRRFAAELQFTISVPTPANKAPTAAATQVPIAVVNEDAQRAERLIIVS